ncbi:hypothetical protein [Xanthomonas euroxanthea]|uniref:hypothetical protein n=1 Tax=Xanthomonas euroxanthea TaxID=2259622 RepID=UPI0016076DD0|nr:hypothetical protein [Xanthomonas euroxanthea]
MAAAMACGIAHIAAALPLETGDGAIAGIACWSGHIDDDAGRPQRPGPETNVPPCGGTSVQRFSIAGNA